MRTTRARVVQCQMTSSRRFFRQYTRAFADAEGTPLYGRKRKASANEVRAELQVNLALDL